MMPQIPFDYLSELVGWKDLTPGQRMSVVKEWQGKNAKGWAQTHMPLITGEAYSKEGLIRALAAGLVRGGTGGLVDVTDLPGMSPREKMQYLYSQQEHPVAGGVGSVVGSVPFFSMTGSAMEPIESPFLRIPAEAGAISGVEGLSNVVHGKKEKPGTIAKGLAENVALFGLLHGLGSVLKSHVTPPETTMEESRVPEASEVPEPTEPVGSSVDDLVKAYVKETPTVAPEPQVPPVAQAPPAPVAQTPPVESVSQRVPVPADEWIDVPLQEAVGKDRFVTTDEARPVEKWDGIPRVSPEDVVLPPRKPGEPPKGLTQRTIEAGMQEGQPMTLVLSDDTRKSLGLVSPDVRVEDLGNGVVRAVAEDGRRVELPVKGDSIQGVTMLAPREPIWAREPGVEWTPDLAYTSKGSIDPDVHAFYALKDSISALGDKYAKAVARVERNLDSGKITRSFRKLMSMKAVEDLKKSTGYTDIGQVHTADEIAGNNPHDLEAELRSHGMHLESTESATTEEAPALWRAFDQWLERKEGKFSAREQKLLGRLGRGEAPEKIIPQLVRTEAGTVSRKALLDWVENQETVSAKQRRLLRKLLKKGRIPASAIAELDALRKIPEGKVVGEKPSAKVLRAANAEMVKRWYTEEMRQKLAEQGMRVEEVPGKRPYYRVVKEDGTVVKNKIPASKLHAELAKFGPEIRQVPQGKYANISEKFKVEYGIDLRRAPDGSLKAFEPGEKPLTFTSQGELDRYIDRIEKENKPIDPNRAQKLKEVSQC